MQTILDYKIILSVFLFHLNWLAVAQSPIIQWQKCLGGDGDDIAFSIKQTIDAGFIIAGNTTSSNGDVSGYHGGLDFGDAWVVKTDSSGNLQWQKCLGGSGDDIAYSINLTNDSGYILVGFTDSDDGDVAGYHDSVDCWVVKLNSVGDIQWQKCLGGSADDRGYSIMQTNDNGYIVGAHSQSTDGDASGNNGNGNYWIVKLNTTGVIQWQKAFGAATGGGCNLKCIQQYIDGGYIVTGETNANDGDVSGNHSLSFDMWVIKVNNIGDLEWQKCFGGSFEDRGYCIQNIFSGETIASGYTGSNDGDVSGNHAGGGKDSWIVKLDSAGNLIWQKCFGGSWDEEGKSIVQTNDSGFVVIGTATSNDGDVLGIHNGTTYRDYWVNKLSSIGTLEWQKCLGGSDEDIGYSIIQTLDNGFALVGSSQSNDGDLTVSHIGFDFWLVKLSPPIGAAVQEIQEKAFAVFPNPANNKLEIKSALVGNGIQEIDKVTVCSFTGQALLQSQHGGASIEMNVQDLAAGIYLLCIHTNQGITTQKFIKE